MLRWRGMWTTPVVISGHRPCRSSSAPDQGLRERKGLRAVAGGASRRRAGGLDQDPQAVVGTADCDARAGSGRRAVLGLDRRPAEELRRALVSAALFTAHP